MIYPKSIMKFGVSNVKLKRVPSKTTLNQMNKLTCFSNAAKHHSIKRDRNKMRQVLLEYNYNNNYFFTACSIDYDRRSKKKYHKNRHGDHTKLRYRHLTSRFFKKPLINSHLQPIALWPSARGKHNRKRLTKIEQKTFFYTTNASGTNMYLHDFVSSVWFTYALHMTLIMTKHQNIHELKRKNP